MSTTPTEFAAQRIRSTVNATIKLSYAPASVAELDVVAYDLLDSLHSWSDAKIISCAPGQPMDVIYDAGARHEWVAAVLNVLRQEQEQWYQRLADTIWRQPIAFTNPPGDLFDLAVFEQPAEPLF